MSETRERQLDTFVQNNILCSVDYIVTTLANGYGGRIQDQGLAALAQVADELRTPLDDWEEAAREAGWKNLGSDAEGARANWRHAREHDGFEFESAQAVCEEYGLDPYQWEIYEYWAVSEWLAGKLQEAGERVGDFGNLKVWGRTTTGQAISMDGVIGAIYDKMMEPIS